MGRGGESASCRLPQEPLAAADAAAIATNIYIVRRPSDMRAFFDNAHVHSRTGWDFLHKGCNCLLRERRVELTACNLPHMLH